MGSYDLTTADGRTAAFRAFVHDERPAIRELRGLFGPDAAKSLDGTRHGLEFLDGIIDNLTSTPGWVRSSMWETLGLADRMPGWLRTRIAYYFAMSLRLRCGGEWQQNSDEEAPDHGMPVFVVGEVVVSPLRIAEDRMKGDVAGGLLGLFDRLVSFVARDGGGPAGVA